MALAVDDQVDVLLPSDSDLDAGRFDGVKPAVWKPPYENDEGLQAESRAWLRRYQNLQAFDEQIATAFLVDVMALCSPPRGGDMDMGVRIHAYLRRMADYPAVVFDERFVDGAARCDKGFFPSWEKLGAYLDHVRGQLVMKAQRHMRIISGDTTPRPVSARLAEPGQRTPPTDEEKAKVAAICAGIRARLGDDHKIRSQDAEQARRDRDARRSAIYAQHLEESRRFALAHEAARKAGLDEFKQWSRFMVAIDQPLAGDLRQHYGHACPGYDPPVTTAQDRHDAKASPPPPPPPEPAPPLDANWSKPKAPTSNEALKADMRTRDNPNSQREAAS